MTEQFTTEELERLTEAELHALYCKLFNELARLHRSVPRCPAKLASIEAVRKALNKRRMSP